MHAELKDLTTKLEDVINWQQFGLNIGIRPSKIQIIEEDYRRVDACKLHLFLEWTKKERPTWNKVIQALVDMQMEDLAKTLGAQYGMRTSNILMIRPLPHVCNNSLISFPGSAYVCTIKRIT